MRTALSVVAFVGLFFAPTAGAQQLLHLPCPNCQAQQMAGTAQAAGLGVWHVYSLPSGVIRQFNVRNLSPDCGTLPMRPGAPGVERTPAAKTGDGIEVQSLCQLVADEIPVDAGVESSFQLLKDMFDESGGSLDKTVEVPAQSLGFTIYGTLRVPTPYELASNPNLRAMLTTHMQNGWSPDAAARWEWFIAHPDAFAAFKERVIVNITVRWPDGSKMEFQYDHNEERVRYVPGEARTANGQLIPEQPMLGDYGGSTWFNIGDDLESLMDYFRRLGVPITGPNGGASPERPLRCTFDGRNLECTGG